MKIYTTSILFLQTFVFIACETPNPPCLENCIITNANKSDAGSTGADVGQNTGNDPLDENPGNAICDTCDTSNEDAGIEDSNVVETPCVPEQREAKCRAELSNFECDELLAEIGPLHHLFPEISGCSTAEKQYEKIINFVGFFRDDLERGDVSWFHSYFGWDNGKKIQEIHDITTVTGVLDWLAKEKAKQTAILEVCIDTANQIQDKIDCYEI